MMTHKPNRAGARFCTTCQLRMDFSCLKGCKKKKKNTQQNVHVSIRLKMFIWSFTEEFLMTPGLELSNDSH